MTRFLVLLAEDDHFTRWDALSDEEREAELVHHRAFSAAVKERGAIVGGEALTHPASARTLRPGPDRPVTDGPFAESVEQLGGFYVIDVADLETAVGCARLLPSTYTIEVRECLDVEVS